MQKIKYILCLTLAILAIAGVLNFSARADAERAQLSQCIERTAKAEGYTGNAHSAEAWQLFASVCSQ